MIPDMDSFEIARHWPWLKSNLYLKPFRAEDRALETLARLQVESGGEPVAIGLKGWAAAGFTRGEGQAAARALASLRDRRVVSRRKGDGQCGHAWSFSPNVQRWRSMPWNTSGRDSHNFILLCRCRAEYLFGALDPGQRGVLARIKFHNHIPDDKHLWRPGVLQASMRGNGNDCAPTAQAGAWAPSLVRANGSNSAPPTVLTEEAKASSLLSEEEEACVTAFKAKIYADTKLPTYGPPLDRLRSAAKGLSLEDARRVIDGLPKLGHPDSGSVHIELEISELRRHHGEALASKRSRLSILSSIDLEGSPELEAERNALAEELSLEGMELEVAAG